MGLLEFGLRFDALVDFLFEIVGALAHVLLDAFVKRLKPGLPFGHLAHVLQAFMDGNHQENILENHPARVLKPTPGTGRQHAKDGLRQEQPAQ